jgi:tRNA A37 threonylcarbamoyltransferase TsaD
MISNFMSRHRIFAQDNAAMIAWAGAERLRGWQTQYVGYGRTPKVAVNGT